MHQEAFEKLIARAATPEEVTRLWRVKEAMGISDKDPFWLILLVLEYYKSLYDGIPEKIRAVSAGCSQELDKLLIERIERLREVAAQLQAPTPAVPTHFSFEFSDAELQKVVAAVQLAQRDQQVPLLEAIRGIKVPSLDTMAAGLSALDGSQQQSMKRLAALSQQIRAIPAPDRAPLPWWGMLLVSIVGSSLLTVSLLKLLTALRFI